MSKSNHKHRHFTLFNIIHNGNSVGISFTGSGGVQRYIYINDNFVMPPKLMGIEEEEKDDEELEESDGEDPDFNPKDNLYSSRQLSNYMESTAWNKKKQGEEQEML